MLSQHKGNEAHDDQVHSGTAYQVYIAVLNSMLYAESR